MEQFPRGFSNLTYLLRLGEAELVLRRPPFGSTVRGAHDVAREFRVLSALQGAFPVPRPLLLCDDDAVIGAPFYVMERVRGVILRDRPPPGLALDAPRMRGICHALVDTLVALHDPDAGAPGLREIGRPDGYVERQVEGWVGRYRAARTDEVPGMERAARWLAEQRPRAGGVAVLHNDFKYDNLVLDPADPTRVLAVLDWEMATRGDPLMDVGTTLGYWAEPGDPPELRAFGVTSLPGNLDRRGFVERYAAPQRPRRLGDPLPLRLRHLQGRGDRAADLPALPPGAYPRPPLRRARPRGARHRRGGRARDREGPDRRPLLLSAAGLRPASALSCSRPPPPPGRRGR